MFFVVNEVLIKMALSRNTVNGDILALQVNNGPVSSLFQKGAKLYTPKYQHASPYTVHILHK